jgi:hypothetical protein
MVDNLSIRDADGIVRSARTAEISTDVHVPIHRLDGQTINGGAISAPALNIDLLTNVSSGWTDISAFAAAAIQIITAAGVTGSVFFEQTNDNSSTTGIPLEVHELGVINQNPLIAAVAFVASTRRAFAFNASCKYMRVRVSTAFAGGNVQAIMLLSSVPFAAPTMNVQQATSGNLVMTANPTTSVTMFALIAAATTNATSIKASAGSLMTIVASNMTASTKWLKLYNLAAAPTVGTSVPSDTIPIPANSYIALEFGPTGLRFSTGIALAMTGAAADSDTTALAAGDVKIHATYF